MSSEKPRWPAALALVASVLGLVFAGLSTLDYVKHLDRQIHDVHCSFIPGLSAEQAENPCRVAMYSPYAALFRDRFWGGVPISLFAVGAFAFFLAFALYFLIAGRGAPRRAAQFLGIFGVTPLIASLVMFTISALRLGTFCKTCVGIYVSSVLLAVASVAAVAFYSKRERAAASLPPDKTTVDEHPYGAHAVAPPPPTNPDGGWFLLPAWAFALGLFAVTPATLYVSALPNYSSYLSGCGKLEKSPQGNTALLRVAPRDAKQPVVLFVDPLCPTCKAFHQRLETEGFLDKLDTTLVLFPLDSECNWMLDRPVHPGACVVSKAVLCGEQRAMQVLEWSYANQEKILDAAKAGAGIVNVRAMIKARFPELDACIDAKETKLRLDKMLRYIVDNRLPVSTPQMFVGETRLCDEDTDMGLSYTLRRLAPALGEGK